MTIDSRQMQGFVSAVVGVARTDGTIATIEHPAAACSHTIHETNAPTVSAQGTADAPPPIFQLKDLPGHMGMRQLIELGIIRPLDDVHAYHTSYGQSVAGRAAVTQLAIPAHVAVCALTACWVWIGGELPGSIDVICSSHFRSTIFGRKIRVFNRQTPEDQCTAVNGLSLTNPVRTACDIATLPDNEWQGADYACLVRRLMDECGVSSAECLELLRVNRFWPNTPRAKRFFARLEE